MNPDETQQQEPQQEQPKVVRFPRRWRVTLLSGKTEDVLAPGPVVDAAGMLAFGDSSNNLQSLFAAGQWVSVKPLPMKAEQEDGAK